MSIDIKYSELWTYRSDGPHHGKEDIDSLDTKSYTHIHGDLSLIIDDKKLPHMGYSNEVCFGYWIEELTRLFKKFKEGCASYTIEGMDQGLPAFLFEKDGRFAYLSIVNSLIGGKADPKWQRIKIDYKELRSEFQRFKDVLLEDIKLKAPCALKAWEDKFR